MLIALLLALGVDLIVVVAFAAFVLGRRRARLRPGDVMAWMRAGLSALGLLHLAQSAQALPPLTSHLEN
jgi:hypothetical protein